MGKPATGIATAIISGQIQSGQARVIQKQSELLRESYDGMTEAMLAQQWFIFILECSAAVIGMILIILAIRSMWNKYRSARYHLGLLIRQIFRFGIKPGIVLYLEISNWRETNYMKLVELDIVPSLIYYLKDKKSEPLISLKTYYFSSEIEILWEDNCAAIISNDHRNTYVSFPMTLTLPIGTAEVTRRILKEAYHTNILVYHSHTFAERARIISLSNTGDMLSRAESMSRKEDRSLDYISLEGRQGQRILVELHEKPASKPRKYSLK